MLLFTLFALWCASDCARGAVSARSKPFYSEASHAQLFEAFKATHHKQYATPEEERHRFEIFKSNLNLINELNAKFTETVYDITQFADLTSDEVVSRHTGLVIDSNRQPGPLPATNFSSVEVPEAFDWREKNVVTRVKQQGTCGSCWAFATIGSLESNYAIKKGQLIEFSEQQLVDCDYGDDHCGGGNPVTACMYLMSKGAMSEADYQYVDRQDNCSYAPGKVLTKTRACYYYAGTSEDNVKKTLYTKGPLAIVLDATNFHLYRGGVYQDCRFSQLNHGLLLVGYGTENGVPFWILKNSWGVNFGEQGYIRIQRGNNCLGIDNLESIIVAVEV